MNTNPKTRMKSRMNTNPKTRMNTNMINELTQIYRGQLKLFN